MTWKDFVYRQVIDFCESAGSRTFSLQDFQKSKIDIFARFRPGNKNVEAKVRQQLQFLRDESLITFVDNSGHYTLRGIEMLKSEIQETKTIDLTKETPEKREYIIETYVRRVAWARKAQEIFGEFCLFKKCENTFFREDGSRYIEVHHIIPLCNGGEDGIWNLSVLCAHHHRMAHFGNANTKNDMEKYLLNEAKARL